MFIRQLLLLLLGLLKGEAGRTTGIAATVGAPAAAAAAAAVVVVVRCPQFS